VSQNPKTTDATGYPGMAGTRDQYMGRCQESFIFPEYLIYSYSVVHPPLLLVYMVECGLFFKRAAR
jgi:hypothetical protein